MLKQHKVVLEFPPDLSEQVGSVSLVVELEVDTREEEGGREEVTYWEGRGERGKSYKLYKSKET